ncbi:hypothetical protein DM02DRAFT_608867 [Periconia macrospinosa]|uniref:EthD domain-containing protein n=1 Tax=Periconia macrospinosa TaxID=97972 RepID=A0A2V1EAC4_9PLEO|nr:hypothetical protein DM02DRAFT_608867 [Periconia macrospinosa]
MAFSIIVFVTRKPTITPEAFKDYWENHHIPLLQSLTGDLFPREHKRLYFARAERKGFGGPANKDKPLLILRGSPEDFDFDATAELTWENEQTFHKFYKAVHRSETQAKLVKDEEIFLDPGKMRTVVIREAISSCR